MRLLNAGVSGKVTIQLDGKTEFSRVKLGRTTRRHTVRAGRHVLTATVGKGKAKKVIARLGATLKKGQRLTIVYAVKGHRPELFLFAEPAAARGAIVFRAANFASAAGAVSIRIGSTVVAKNIRFGGVTSARRLFPRSSATGLLKVSARHGHKTMTAKEPLVLATKSVGLFVVIPRGRRAQVVRLPYTTPVPAPTHQPKLSGARRFGHSLRCTGDGWRPKAAVRTRRWTVDGRVVGGGTTKVLTTAEDAGHNIACVVTATLNGMTTTVVAAFNFPAVPIPVVLPSVKAPGGTLAPNQILTCDHGAWKSAPTTFAYRWFRRSTGATIGSGRTHIVKLPDDNGTKGAFGCEVVATNNGGVSAPARSSNTVATNVPPGVQIDASSKPLNNHTTSNAITFTWSVSGGGADTVTCKLDAGPTVPCASQTAQSYNSLATDVSGTSHTFIVTARNPFGAATTSYTWTVDPLPPAVTITSGPSRPTSTDASPVFTWVVSGGPSTVSCDLDGVPIGCSSTGVTLNLNPADAGGTPHALTVTVTNVTRAGGVSAPTYTWTLLPDLPTVAFGTVPAKSSGDTSPTFTWTAGGGGATGFSCQFDAGPVHSCGTPLQPSETLSAVTADPFGAPHSFTVTATNARGTSSPATYSWNVFSAPAVDAVTTDAVDGGPSADVTVSFTVSGTTTALMCQITGQAAVPCDSTTGHVFTSPGPGTYTVTVSASNAGGTNSASSSQWTFT